MSQSQTAAAAQALVNAVKQYDGEVPRASSPVWRKVITETLGIKKLYTSRLNKILEAAKDLGLEVADDSYSVKGKAKEDSRKKDVAKIPKKIEKPFSRNKTSTQYMDVFWSQRLEG